MGEDQEVGNQVSISASIYTLVMAKCIEKQLQVQESRYGYVPAEIQASAFRLAKSAEAQFNKMSMEEANEKLKRR